ncbi:uncharacterized protein [Aegilops tauschii subsp. strangulata]|uniref:uncharacterized protein n=1 Tax=Aegilops tauschii subsp. strangulata TaxID=200361 RepID=UPI00098AB6DA|nr:uncharacterized protein LOC109787278 [Aegilops tauschii subsp. strangulata]
MEELISSGLAGMDISILHGGEGEGEDEGEDASATREQREEKMKDVRRENHDEYINSTPPPCPSSLGPTRFTFGSIPSYARPHCTMQIFSVRVADLEDGLQWPLHVHGLVAARDTSDHNRNFLFNRTRDNCQVLTQQDPYLLLTGPSRAIVIIDPITIEFQLKVKSKMYPEEDEMLAFGIFNYPQTYLATHVIRSRILCDRCTIELAYAPLDPSVEATVIGVRIIDGVWPEGLRGRVVTEVTTVREGEVLLLDSRDGKMPISPSTGVVELSRRVVSVDLEGGKLVVSVVASPQTAGKEDGDDGGGAAVVVARGEAVFAPKRAGTSSGTCDLGFCKVEVAVAWSLVSSLWNERRALAKLAEERP